MRQARIAAAPLTPPLRRPRLLLRAPRGLLLLPRIRNEFQRRRDLPAFGKARRGLVDLRERRQACFVAEALDRVGRGRTGELEVLLPADIGISQIGEHISAMEDVAGAV